MTLNGISEALVYLMGKYKDLKESKAQAISDLMNKYNINKESARYIFSLATEDQKKINVI
jgi:ABC-type uncharacterized transport system ATPase subunit